MTGPVLAAFIRRDAQVAWSYRMAFAFDALAGAMTLVTFRLVARVVEPSAVLGDYFTFVTVGLALSAFLQAGVSRVSANVRQEQVQGTLESTLACGLPVPLLAVGLAGYPIVSSAVRAVAYVLMAALLGARTPLANWPVGVMAGVLGAVSFVGIGLVCAALVLLLRQAAALTTWVVAGLSLCAGVMFPPALLPGWARVAGQLSPFTWALRVLRNALLTGAPWSASWRPLAVLACLAIALSGCGILALGGALRRAKHTGGVSQY